MAAWRVGYGSLGPQPLTPSPSVEGLGADPAAHMAEAFANVGGERPLRQYCLGQKTGNGISSKKHARTAGASLALPVSGAEAPCR